MNVNDEEFKKLFNAKPRLPCAGCGSISFSIFPTPMPNTPISEAVMMKCKDCGHTRLELVS